MMRGVQRFIYVVILNSFLSSFVTALRVEELPEGGFVADQKYDDESQPAAVTLITPTWTVSAQGTGTSYALACNAESHSYEQVILQGLSWQGSNTLVSIQRTSTSYVAPTTVLCDGRTRLLGTLTPVASGVYWYKDWPQHSYSGPPPSCSIQSDDCLWLQTSFLSASSIYMSSWSKDVDALTGLPPSPPACSVDGVYESQCGGCTIHGGEVQMLYFPPTTPPTRDMCATAPFHSIICPYGSTYSNDDTRSGLATAPCPYIDVPVTSTSNSGPYTIINQTTFYSNRVYISYETLFATNQCGRVGGAYANSVVEVPSSDVYSVSGYHFALTHAAYSFNFGDLVPPVPASAYLCQPNCEDSDGNLGIFGDGDIINGVQLGRLGFCTTIIDAAYRPILAVPPQMRGIDPAWKSCMLGLDGLYDPPKALAPQTTVDGVSLPYWATDRPQPGSTPTSDSPIFTTPYIPTHPAATSLSDVLPASSIDVVRTTILTTAQTTSKRSAGTFTFPSYLMELLMMFLGMLL